MQEKFLQFIKLNSQLNTFLCRKPQIQIVLLVNFMKHLRRNNTKFMQTLSENIGGGNMSNLIL